MFKQAATEKFWSTVKAEYTREDGSKGTIAFDVQFKRLSMPQIRALAAECEGADDADLKYMQGTVVDWRKVTDDDGAEVPFSSAALQELFSTGFGGAVVKTYFAALPRAREKN